ncbi:MAG: RRQRL motif-containing zinc-binding protein [Mycobacteriales bacterium]
MSRYRHAFWDPDGTRYGIPTYPWRMAPDGLATRRQLAATGLRPGGQPVVAQVMWRSHWSPTGIRVAYLYQVTKALPKRTPTPAVLAAVAKATAARRWCPTCQQDAGYVLPARWGMCLDCATGYGLVA